MNPARAALLAAALVMAGCGEVPRPFRHEGDNPMVAPVAARTVVVVAPEETPLGSELAAAVVHGLLAVEIPATLRDGGGGAWRLQAHCVRDAATVTLRWSLARGAETRPGPEQRIPLAAWGEAGPRLVAGLSAEVVAAMVPALRQGPAVATPVPSPPADPPVASRPTVRLRPLTGVPGDGAQALTRAMRPLLAQLGLEVVAADQPADFDIRAQVTVVPDRGGEDMLSLAWTVSRGDGTELGSAAQQGAVPRGRVNGPWGSLADDIAAGGVDGIVAILRARANR